MKLKILNIKEAVHIQNEVSSIKPGLPLYKSVSFSSPKIPRIGCLKDSIIIVGDLTEPTGEVWEAETI